MTPMTKAGKWLVERTRWDEGMRGFFVRINQTGGPEDMLVHVVAIEREALAELASAATPILADALMLFPEEWVDAESSMAMSVVLRGRDLYALRAALRGVKV